MSYPPHHAYPPPPPGPQPKQGLPTGAKIALGCGGAAVLVVGGLLFLAIVGFMVGDPSTTADSSSERTTEAAAGDDSGQEEAQEHPGIGDTVSHGDWEITVTGVEYDAPTSELGVFAEDPSGRWIVVSLEATNTSSGPTFFDSSDQVLMDADGSMYRADIMASDGISALDQVNPGGQVGGRLAYDVPEDVEIDHMLVNGESMFADGVRVDLD